MLTVDLFIAAIYTGKERHSLNRCWIKLQMMFVSEMVTANCRQIHRQYMLPQVDEQNVSKYKFPHKEPMASDWVKTACLWPWFSYMDLYLVEPLGL